MSYFDDFTERSTYWRWRVDNYASFSVEKSILRMCMGPTEALYYSNAEIADGEFDELPWRFKTFEIRVRMTGQHFGSAGWGFWNHSMRVDLSVPIWFIYLRAYGRYPLQGFFIQVANVFLPVKLFASISKLYYGLKLFPQLAPIKILSRRPLAQNLDLQKWHTYKIRWTRENVEFYIDEEKIATIDHTPHTNCRADVWIDNAVFTPKRGDPGHVYRHVTQENRVKTCLEIDWIRIS